MAKQFSLLYPVAKESADFHLLNSKFGNINSLVVTGKADVTSANVLNNIGDRYEFEIEEIIFHNVNVFPLIKAFHLLDKIQAFCYNQIKLLLNGDSSSIAVTMLPVNHQKRQGNYNQL